MNRTNTKLNAQGHLTRLGIGKQAATTAGCLIEFSRWYRGCDWTMVGNDTTQALMERLEHRGLAQRSDRGQYGSEWRPTELLLAIAEVGR